MHSITDSLMISANKHDQYLNSINSKSIMWPVCSGRLCSSEIVPSPVCDHTPAASSLQQISQPSPHLPLLSPQHPLSSEHTASETAVSISSESETEHSTSRLKKPRRSRTIFTALQLLGLEKKFQKQKYLSTQTGQWLMRKHCCDCSVEAFLRLIWLFLRPGFMPHKWPKLWKTGNMLFIFYLFVYLFMNAKILWKKNPIATQLKT